jgi:hypothetical protein
MRNDAYFGYYRTLLHIPETGAWAAFDHAKPYRKTNFWVRYSSSCRVPNPVRDHPELLIAQLSEETLVRKFENAVDPEAFEEHYERLDSLYERSQALKTKRLPEFQRKSANSQLGWGIRKAKIRLEELVRKAIIERKKYRVIRTKRKAKYYLSLR